MTDTPISPEEVQRQTSALETVAADLHRDHTERQSSDRRAFWALIAAIVLGVIDLVGVGLLWTNFTGVNESLNKLDRLEDVSFRSRDSQIVQECSTASTRIYPRLLADSAELTKALAWAKVCRDLNGVRASTIKLPPKP